MASGPLRMGVIGTGFGARVHIPAFQSEGIEVVAVCSQRRDRAEAAAKDLGIADVYTDYREMLNQTDMDAVSITTPPALHHEMVLQSLASGKHVLCEKPFAMNESEARGMWEVAGDKGLTTMIAHEYRFAPPRAYVKELLSQGYVGNVQNVHMSLFGGPTQPRGARSMGWNDQASMGGGTFGALGSHYIDCLRDWCGEITRACGLVSLPNPDRLEPDTGKTVQSDADEAYGFLVTLQNGGWASMSGSTDAPFGSGTRIEIYGSEGSLQMPQPLFDPTPNDVVLGARFGEEGGVHELPMPQKFLPFEDNRNHWMVSFRILVRKFLQGIAEGTSPAPNFYDGLRCQQVLDAIRYSSTGGGWVDIPAE